MRCSLRCLALLAFALPLACSDRSGTPTPTAPPGPRSSAHDIAPAADACGDAAAAATLGGTESHGAMLVRYDLAMPLFMLQDQDNGLWVVYSSGDPPMFPCGGTPTLMMSVREVFRRGDDRETAMYHYVAKAPELFAKVWRWPFNFCSTPPIAAGTVHAVGTDNDANAGLSERHNVASYGLTAEGTLLGQDGRPYHFTGVWRARYQRTAHDPTECFREFISNKLEPLGRGS